MYKIKQREDNWIGEKSKEHTNIEGRKKTFINTHTINK